MKTLILLDSDNFLAPDARKHKKTLFSVALSFIRGRVLSNSKGGTFIIVGGTKVHTFDAKLLWPEDLPQPRYLFGVGEDGTDKQLITVMTEEEPESRYTNIIVMSGDHIYSSYIDELHMKNSDLVSEIVSTRRGLSSVYHSRYEKNTLYKGTLVRLSKYVGVPEEGRDV